MKISKLTTPISFEKKLIATCTVQKDNRPLHCNIFELNKDEDEFYFENIERKKEWETNVYLHEARCALEEDNTENESFFVLENKKRQCLGFAITETIADENTVELNLLETCHPHSSRNEDRKIKYIGETLVSFLAKLAQKENLSSFDVPISSKYAKNFYKNCGFKEIGSTGFFRLQNRNFDKLIEQNEYNTDGRIELIL